MLDKSFRLKPTSSPSTLNIVLWIVGSPRRLPHVSFRLDIAPLIVDHSKSSCIPYRSTGKSRIFCLPQFDFYPSGLYI